MNETQSRASSPARAALVAVALTVAAFLGTVIVGVAVLIPMFSAGYELTDTPVLVVATVATQLAFLAVGFLYVRRYGLRISLSRPGLRSLGIVIVGVVVALAVAMGLLLVVSVLDLQPDSALEESAAADPTYLLALAVLSLVLIGPAEEFLFRGVVQGRLRKSFGPAGAIVGASLLFGSMHLFNYLGSPAEVLAGALLISCVGVVFGALYELTDNLVVPILVHGIYNVVLMLSSYFAL
ncbi:CPBP family intramembrane glutamic endopeptidase [Natrialbaceae archaeon GCM10025810]|uniref:CPBP family intramembrane glutamic endopeptidase n=1 Tax=Halovalidus salilacus TaxID=3075124 RepID=UPI00360B1696